MKIFLISIMTSIVLVSCSTDDEKSPPISNTGIYKTPSSGWDSATPTPLPSSATDDVPVDPVSDVVTPIR